MGRRCGWLLVIASWALTALPVRAEPPPAAADTYGDPLPPHARARLGTTRFHHLGFHGVVSAPEALTFSAGGKTLASLAADGSICVWQAATGRLLRRFGHPAQGGPMASIAFSPDGKLLAARYGMGSYLWDVATGGEVPLRRPWAASHDIQIIAFSPDGKSLALLHGGKIYLRDATTDEDLRTFAPAKGACWSVLFAPDGRTLLGGAVDGTSHTVYFWDVATGKELRRITAADTYLHSAHLALSPDGRVLAAGGVPIRLWNADIGKELRPLDGGGFNFAFSADGKMIASRGLGPIRLYETSTGKWRGSLKGFSPNEQTLAFSPDDRTVALNGYWGSIHLLDLVSGEELRPLGGHRGSVEGIVCSADGTVLASAGLDRTVRVWDPATGQERRRFPLGEGKGAVALAPDGKTLATGDHGGARLWDAGTGREIRQLGTDEVLGLAFSPDGQAVATSGRETALWDAATGRLLRRLGHGGHASVVFSPDGKLLTAGGGGLWDVATGRLVRTLGNGRLGGGPCAFSPDGTLLAVGGGQSSRDVTVYEVSTGKVWNRFPAPLTDALAFTAGGKALAGADPEDHSIVLWDPATGDELLRLRGHGSLVTSLVSPAGGKYLVSGSRDSTVLVWDLPPLRVPPRAPMSITAVPLDRALLLVDAAERPALLEALGHPEPEVRAAAVRKLGPLADRDRTVLAALVQALREKDDQVRDEAFRALCGTGPAARSAAPELAGLLAREQARREARPTEPAAAPQAGKSTRTDAFGDPLPPGAIARLGTTRLRHTNLVRGLAFSPDSATLASAGDGCVRLWRVADGREVRRFREHQGRESGSVQFTPDGRGLFSKDDGNVVRLWDVATGKELRRFQGEKGWTVTDFALSPDGEILAVNSAGMRVLLLDPATGKELRRIEGLEGRGGWQTFSADGRLLRVHDGLWEVATGRRLPPVAHTAEFITSAALTSDGTVLATSHGDLFADAPNFETSVRLWDAATGKPLRRFKGPSKCIYEIAFSPDGKTLAVAGDDPVVRLWDASSGKELGRLPGFHFRLSHVTFSPDGKLLAAADEDSRIFLWDLTTGRPLHPFDRDEGYLLTVAYSPDGRTVAGAGDEVIRLRDAATGKHQGELRGHTGRVLSVAYSPDGTRLASGGTFREGTTRLWDVAARTEVRRFADNGGPVAFSPDGKYLASGRDPLRLRAAASGEELGRIPHWEVRCLGFSPDGKRLAAGADVRDAHVYQLPGGEKLTRFGRFHGQEPFCEVIALAFSPDENTLASVQPILGVNFLEVDPGTGRRSRHACDGTGGATAVAYAPDGKTLALGRQDGVVSLWDVATARERGRLVADQGKVRAVVFAPDGRTLTAVYGDGSGLVWDVSAASY